MNTSDFFLLGCLLVSGLSHFFLSIRVTKIKQEICKDQEIILDGISVLMDMNVITSMKDKMTIRENLIQKENYEKAKILDDMIKKDMDYITNKSKQANDLKTEKETKI